MTTAETIMEHVVSLSEYGQTEVLDFVEYRESKKKVIKKRKTNWSEFSVSQVMCGMEMEESIYSSADIKEEKLDGHKIKFC